MLYQVWGIVYQNWVTMHEPEGPGSGIGSGLGSILCGRDSLPSLFQL